MKYVAISQSKNKNIKAPLITKMEFTEILIADLQENDPEIILDCLDSFYILLKKNQIHLMRFVFEKLENLKVHKNQWICEKAGKILEILLEGYE